MNRSPPRPFSSRPNLIMGTKTDPMRAAEGRRGIQLRTAFRPKAFRLVLALAAEQRTEKARMMRFVMIVVIVIMVLVRMRTGRVMVVVVIFVMVVVMPARQSARMAMMIVIIVMMLVMVGIGRGRPLGGGANVVVKLQSARDRRLMMSDGRFDLLAKAANLGGEVERGVELRRRFRVKSLRGHRGTAGREGECYDYKEKDRCERQSCSGEQKAGVAHKKSEHVMERHDSPPSGTK